MGGTMTAESRETPLHLSSANGHLGVVKALIEAGADAIKDDPIDEKATPMYLASQGGHDKVVQYLLDLGADPRMFNNVRRTPLHIAANNGHLNVVRVLLSKP